MLTRIVTGIVLTSWSTVALAQSPAPSPVTEASCLQGVTMTPERKARFERLARIDFYRLQLRAGESDADRVARIRQNVACTYGPDWAKEDANEKWEREVDALSPERQTELWKRLTEEKAKRAP